MHAYAWLNLIRISMWLVRLKRILNYIVRTLKSIANNKQLGLSIQQIEIVRYEERQLELLYKHDIEFDEMIPEAAKTEALKEAYIKTFLEAKNPVI
jgi:hypothetical protein